MKGFPVVGQVPCLCGLGGDLDGLCNFAAVFSLINFSSCHGLNPLHEREGRLSPTDAPVLDGHQEHRPNINIEAANLAFAHFGSDKEGNGL